MIICNEIELTKNEILATIYVLVVCFNMDLALAMRLIQSTISAENLKPRSIYSQ